MKKKIYVLMAFFLAFVGNVMAWEPVIKETHWFGVYEYEGYEYGFGDVHDDHNWPGKTINWSGNYLESIIVVKSATGQDPHQRPKTSFYSWLDHQLRFRVNATGNWSLEKNGHGTYNGLGLYNNSSSGTCFWICNLKKGDQFNIEYYREPGNTASTFLAAQDGALSSVKNEAENRYVYAESAYSGNSGIYGAGSDGQLVYYTVEEDGDVAINIPSHTVIRSVSIILNDEQYQAAESSVEPLQTTDLQKYLGDQYNTSSFGYRYYYTQPGVLEDKQGAVPYITMQFGSDNDMTFVRKLSDGGQVTTTNEYWEEIPATVLSKDRGETEADAPTVKYLGDRPYYAVDNNPNNGDNYGGAEWESQLWIGNTQLSSLPAGTQVRVSFWRYASQSTQTAVAQAHGPNAGDYIPNPNLFSIEFGGWAYFETVIEVSEVMANADWNYIAFNLNPNNAANEYGFAEVKLEVLRREAVTTQSEGDFGAASIIDANNDFNPEHHQYHIYNKVFLDPSDNSGGVDIHPSGQRTEQDLRRMFIGKEWSVFKSQHAPESIPYSSNASYNGQVVVWRDIFDTIFPLCGNFFYFFPEVDGKLVVEYYCEGAEENPAFWWKTDAEGNPQGGGSQGAVNCKQYDLNGNQIGESVGHTNGTNNYYLTADLKRGCVYYLCSLPTNNAHEHPIIRVKSYSFIPKFAVSPLTLVVNNTNDIDDENVTNKVKHAAEIFGGPYENLNVNGTFTRNGENLDKVRYFGNVESADVEVVTEGSQQFLKFSNIQFVSGKNPGGAIVVHLSDACGEANFVLTVAYDAVEAKWGVENGKDKRVRESEDDTREVKHWDFFSNTNWDLGKYSDTNSKLWKEIHKGEDKTADWNNTYINLPEQKEPIFKSVYDMEADNVDMIHETEGLVIHAHSNLVGIYNEDTYKNGELTPFQDRYIGFMPGSKLVIPRLKQNDRVVIKMGAYGNADETVTTKLPVTLTLNNAKDAMGTLIEDDYIIGGSAEDTDATTKDATLPHGEYHFIVANNSDRDDDDFSIEVKDGQLLKIYSVVIYRNAVADGEDIDLDDQVILSENQVMGDDDKRYLLVTEETNEDDYALLYLNYRGQDEPTTFHQEKRMTGNVVLSGTGKNITVSSGHAPSDPNNAWLNITASRPDSPENATFGIIKSRMGVETKDKEYVTDYAECMIPVGYRQLMDYPYTWDFTDLKANYISDGIDENGVEKDVDVEDLKIWDGYKFRSAPETYDGYIFSPGGQLYGGATMFDETRGIGIVHKGENEAMSLTDPKAQDGKGDGGLAIVDGQTLEFVVPQVPVNGAVYVHARKVADASKAKLQNRIKTKAATAYTEAANFTFVGTDDNGDEVFAIKNNDSHEVYINLSVQGYEVNKIAVATDEKKVNVKGYASESRDHDIDAKLLPYFTGQLFKTYLVSDPDYTNLKLTLTDIASTDENFVMPANTGCVIRRTGDAADLQFNPFKDGKGFHLFVPDMHDTEKVVTAADKAMNDQYMVPVATEMQIPYSNNYVKLIHEGYDGDGAVWYAYTWSTDQDQTWIPESNGGRFIGLKDNVIFVRMNPEYKNNPSWEGKWNQTGNLTVQKGKTFTITGWGLDGEWSGDAVTGDMTNYVLTYRYKKLNGSTLSDAMFEGEEKFYRVYSGWDIWLRANSAYLQLPTASVLPDNAARSARMISFRVVNNVMPGDVNYDETVNVADFISVGSSILGKSPAVFYTKGADVNNDTNINVSDFIGIANIILSTPDEDAAPAQAPRRASMNGNGLETSDYAVDVRPLTATEPGKQQVLSIRMKNTQPLVGYEFTILLPDGVTIATDDEVAAAQLSNARTTAQRTNFFAAQQLGNNALKVLCGTTNGDSDGLYSFTGTDGEVARITVNIAEGFNPDNYEVAVIDGLCTNRECMSMPLVPMSFNVTGISDVMAEGEAVEGSNYYNLQGQRLGNRPAQRGVYIVNGKKVTVK